VYDEGKLAMSDLPPQLLFLLAGLIAVGYLAIRAARAGR